MKFKDVELLPGTVIDVNDPKKLGRIKCVVPGLFDTGTMEKEGLPWVYPISMIGNQGFSKLQEGSKVWVYKIEGNYREFWYMPMFQLNPAVKKIVSEYEEPDVLIARSAGANSVYIYYTDKQGIMLKLGDNSFINLKTDGSILAKSGTGQIEIKDNNVYIGGENAKDHNAVLGDKLVELLNKLKSNLNDLAEDVASSPYTTHLFSNMLKTANDINTNLLCSKTFVE